MEMHFFNIMKNYVYQQTKTNKQTNMNETEFRHHTDTLIISEKSGGKKTKINENLQQPGRR